MLHYLNKTKEELGVRYTERYERGADALAVLEKGLAGRTWLVGSAVSLADIALFAYTHVADEAGYRLSDYPAISAWIAEFKKLPWYRRSRRPDAVATRGVPILAEARPHLVRRARRADRDHAPRTRGGAPLDRRA